jgi:hypothetical protein
MGHILVDEMKILEFVLTCPRRRPYHQGDNARCSRVPQLDPQPRKDELRGRCVRLEARVR